MLQRLGKHRLLTAMAVCLLVVFIATFTASRVVGYVFQSRLSKALAAKGKVRAEFGIVLYRPPYTFFAADVHILAPRPDGAVSQRFAARSMTISLDHFPRPGEPLSIDKLIARHAMFNIGDRAEPAVVDRAEISIHELAQRGIFEGKATLSDGPGGSVAIDGTHAHAATRAT
jgi:hypothetical protein